MWLQFGDPTNIHPVGGSPPLLIPLLLGSIKRRGHDGGGRLEESPGASQGTCGGAADACCMSIGETKGVSPRQANGWRGGRQLVTRPVCKRALECMCAALAWETSGEALSGSQHHWISWPWEGRGIQTEQGAGETKKQGEGSIGRRDGQGTCGEGTKGCNRGIAMWGRHPGKEGLRRVGSAQEVPPGRGESRKGAGDAEEEGEERNRTPTGPGGENSSRRWGHG